MRCLIALLSSALFISAYPLQNEQNVQRAISAEDSLTLQSYRRAMASHVNANPDSALFYVFKIKQLSTEKSYGIGLADADYLHASYFQRVQKFDSAIIYFKRSLRRAMNINYSRGIAVSNNGLCRIYYRIGRVKDAIESCQSCLATATEINDLIIISGTYIALGNIYNRENDLKQSLSYFLKVDSLHEIESLRPDIIAAAYQSLGTIYQELEDYEQAENYFKKGNTEFKKMPVDPTYYLKTTQWHLGEIYFRQGQLLRADSLLQDSHAFFKKVNDDHTVAEIDLSLGLLNIQKQQLDVAEKYLIEGFNLHKQNGNKFETSMAALELGKLYLEKKQSKKAVKYLREASQVNSNDSSSGVNRYESLIKLSEALVLEGNFSDAYEILRMGMAQKDSLNDLQSLARIKEFETIYQTEKKEQEIELLTAQKLLAEQEKEKQLYLLTIIIIITIVAAIIFYILYRNRQKVANKLRELDGVKSNFFANISHEFRTPLTLIKGPAQEHLSNGEVPQAIKNDLKLIDRNADRLLSLVDQLLDLSKLEAGSMKLAVQEGNIASFLNSVVSSFHYPAQQKNMTFNRSISEESGSSWFDQDILEKIVTNLLSNAIKYTPEGGEIQFSFDYSNGEALISVKNNGNTLKTENIEKVFERFYQAENTGTGVGIGLALVKELTTLHKGSIHASLTKDWIEFEVKLPIIRNAFASTEFESTSATYKEPSIPVIELGSNSVSDEIIRSETDGPILLIIEDNSDVRNLVKGLFEDSYSVIEAADGAMGIEKAIENVPDIIISDVMMPEKDGVELSKTLKNDERTSHIPIILLTAKAGEENEFAGLETGADDYVTKPFSNELLKLRVQKLIELRATLRQRYSQEVVLRPKDIALSSADEKFLVRVQKLLDEKLADSNFNAELFSTEMGMSRMQLHRKLKALIGLTTTEFLRSQRLKLAAYLLQKEGVNMSEIGYAVGFSDPSYFARCFKETYGCTPTEYSATAKSVN